MSSMSYSRLHTLAARYGMTRSQIVHFSMYHVEVEGVKDVNIVNQSRSAQINAPQALTTHPERYPNDWHTQATVYMHWPYCEKRCTYCNFNKYISKSVDHHRMKMCLEKETASLVQLSQVKNVMSVFFGGGTPSLAQPSTLAAVLDTVSRVGHLAEGAEVSMEANPTSLEMSKLKDFKLAGINRLSLGVQTLSDSGLSLLGRQHSGEESLRCLELARELFPGKTSTDLIFGYPGQTLEAWNTELETILKVCDDHISLYQLTLERGTALFKRVHSGELVLPDSDIMADMYELAVQVLQSQGFIRYEVSNFARNGAESIHNKAYWQGTQYIGIGPGAHGRFVPSALGRTQREARIQTLEPDPWMYEVERYGHATRRAVPQTNLDILEELLMLGLRMKEGIPNERWEQFSDGISLTAIFGNSQIVSSLQKEGLLMLDKRAVAATDKGLGLLDSILPHLIGVLNQYFPSTRLPDYQPSGS